MLHTDHKSMGRLITLRICMLVLPMYTLMGEHLSADPITYDIGTINFPGGHTATGTITTNGMIGPLSPADFTAWTVNVVGPTPFVFTDASPTTSLQVFDVSASATLLLSSEFFAINDIDNSSPDCTDCFQVIAWADSFDQLLYHHIDQDIISDSTPSVVENLFLPGSPLTIGVAIIPEPTTSALALAALCMAMSRCLPTDKTCIIPVFLT